jgi:hypothetical protein
MNLFTTRQWFVLAIGAVVGFLALYFVLDYGLWASLGLEVVLVSATIGAQAWKMSQAKRQQ